MRGKSTLGAAIALALLATTPAMALSCIAPDPAFTFNELNKRAERYTIVVGTLTYDRPAASEATPTPSLALPKPQERRIAARLKGHVVSKSGFTTPYDKQVSLHISCAGDWCGGAKSGTTYLAFVNIDKNPPEVTANACGTMMFADPTAATKRQMVDCVNGRSCSSGLVR